MHRNRRIPSSCRSAVVAVLLGLLDEVGDLFEQCGDVVVLDDDALREVERRGGEVQHAADARIDDGQDELRGHLRRRGDNHDADVALLGNLLERIHVVAGNAVDGLAHLLGVDVEGGRDFQIEPLAVEVLGDGLAQMAHTQHGDVHRRRAVENLADVFDEHLHVVALLRVAREADEHQVAAHLHGRDAVDARKHVGEDVRDALLVAREQRAAVFAQPLDGLFGNAVRQ